MERRNSMVENFLGRMDIRSRIITLCFVVIFTVLLFIVIFSFVGQNLRIFPLLLPVAMATVVSLFASHIVSRTITRPLNSMAEVIKSSSKTSKLPKLESQLEDEVCELMVAINLFSASVQNLIAGRDDAIRKIEDEVKAQRQKLDEQNSMVASLKEQSDRLIKEQHEKQREHSAKIKAVEDQKELLEKELSVRCQEIQLLDSYLKSKSTEIEQLIISIDEYKDKLGKESSAKALLESITKKLYQETKDKNSILASLKSVSAKVETKARDRIKGMEEEIKKLRDTVEKHSQNEKLLNHKVLELSREKEMISAATESARKVNEKLREQLETASIELEKVRADCVSSRSELDKLKLNLDTMTLNHKEELARMNEINNALSSRVDCLLKEKEQLASENYSLTLELQRDRNDFAGKLEQMSADLRSHESEISLVKTSVEQIVKALLSERDALKLAAIDLEKKEEVLFKQLRDDVASLNTFHASLTGGSAEKSVDELRALAGELSSRLEGLNSRLDDVTAIESKRGELANRIFSSLEEVLEAARKLQT